MTPDDVVPIAVTTRNGVVESVHFGAVVCLDADGAIAWHAGDPDVPIYPRSSLKPLQAAAMLGAGLDAAADHLAVACGSHFGQEVHTAAVLGLLERHGLGADALGNTPAMPLDHDRSIELTCRGEAPSPLYQNCSGKHAAMLATCVANGWPLDTYLDPAHPVQQAIDRYLADAAGAVVHTGIDGCGAPTAVLRLSGLAAAMRSLVVERSPCHESMVRFPLLVAGDAHEDTQLMRALPGAISKGGAEAVGVVVTPDGRTVAVKVADGSDRARLPVLLAALASLGVAVPEGAVPVPPVLGHGRPVGEVVALVP